MPRARERRADVLPQEEREGPEKERLEHADLEKRLPHPKSLPRLASRKTDRVGRQ